MRSRLRTYGDGIVPTRQEGLALILWNHVLAMSRGRGAYFPNGVPLTVQERVVAAVLVDGPRVVVAGRKDDARPDTTEEERTEY